MSAPSWAGTASPGVRSSAPGPRPAGSGNLLAHDVVPHHADEFDDEFDDDLAVDLAVDLADGLGTEGAPPPANPFTAALARMVAGDREVREAVEVAVQATAEPEPPELEPEPELPEPEPEADRAWRTEPASASSPRAVVTERGRPGPAAPPAPTTTSPPRTRPGAPLLHVEPAPAEDVVRPRTVASSGGAVSPREEAIAETLRAALAQGHSDEALRQVLQEVLAASAPWPTGPVGPEHDAPVQQPAPARATGGTNDGFTSGSCTVRLNLPALDVPGVGIDPDVVEVVDTVEGELVDLDARPLLRTASDPAPLPLDATTVMPPLSLLPPRGASLPPVPPLLSRRSLPPVPRVAPARPGTVPPGTELALARPERRRGLATVTRLPVVADQPETGWPARAELVGRLRDLGVPSRLLGPAFLDDAAVSGTYAALTRAFTVGLPPIPAVPDGAGEVLVVVGPGVETLRAARALAVSLCLEPERVQWATRGDLAGLAPKGSRITTVDGAVERRQEAAGVGTPTVVAVDVPLRTDPYWVVQMLTTWTPDAVWAVVDATRKPEDVQPWLAGLPRVDALVVQDCDLSTDPAAVLEHVDLPVALLDGAPATPHRWASLLCERLDGSLA